MEKPQKVVLPAAYYPVRIIAWKVQIGQIVAKDQLLGVFESSSPAAVATVPSTEADESSDKKKAVYAPDKPIRGEIRSAFEGRVDSISVHPGDLVADAITPLMIVIEPCGHPVQLNGLCAVCGKDLSIPDYTGTETVRATIAMTHDSLGVTVSQHEALRIEQETAERLKSERKLSLVLDLDQTVIHATVDPTVGEWMADPENPNFPALTEVHSFVLPDSPVVYYIKLRPGTRQFLEELHKKYEMHIYTMGTRNYARSVAKILDPDQRYFKDRILSRDDSGSFSVKSLQRLFPCDQSMVVVVDDRADVWQWSPNLFRVKAYDFFVGIGDINEPAYAVAAEINEAHRHKNHVMKTPTIASAQNALTETVSPATQVPTSSSQTAKRQSMSTSAANLQNPSASKSDDPDDEASLDDDTETDEEKAEILAKMHDVQLHALEDQQKNRPLLHSQEVVDAEDNATKSTSGSTQQAPTAGSNIGNVPNQMPTQTSQLIVPKKRPVLIDHDRELDLILSLMNRTHRRFYKRIDLGATSLADVRVIIPEMKRSVLDSVHIVFSSIIPLGTDPRRNEHWITATSFGATCHVDLDDDVTHVIAGKKGTAKVNAARDRSGVVIVKLDWLTESIRTWKRADELAYLFDAELVPDRLPLLSIRRESKTDYEHYGLDGDDSGEQGRRDGDDDDDEDENEILIAAGKWDGAEEIEKLGDENWLEMDDEVTKAMLEDGGIDDDDDQDDAEVDPLIDLRNAPTKISNSNLSVTETIAVRRGATPKPDEDDWDALAHEIVDDLQQTETPPRSSSPAASFAMRKPVVARNIQRLDAPEDDNPDFFEEMESWNRDGEEDEDSSTVYYRGVKRKYGDQDYGDFETFADDDEDNRDDEDASGH